MPSPLADRVVVMSGGSRGIGLAIAVALARAGARIALMAKTDQPHPQLPGTIHTAAEEIEAAGGEALRRRRRRARRRAGRGASSRAAAERWGGVDVVVNNASAINLAPIAALEPKRYDLMLDINTRGTLPAHARGDPAPARVRPRARADAQPAAQHRPALAARPRRLHGLEDGHDDAHARRRRGRARARRRRQLPVAADADRDRRGAEPARRRRGDGDEPHARDRRRRRRA